MHIIKNICLHDYATQETFMLSKIENGQKVKLEKINGGVNLKTKLASMNIKLGTIIQVVKTNDKGAFIIALKNDRLILGHGIVKKLEVSIVE